jgi:tryptophanyl-tRNA synthetase
MKVKRFLNSIIQAELEPIRLRRQEYEKRIPEVYEMLREGSIKAEKKATETLEEVKSAMKINYFDNDEFLQSQLERFGK